MTKQKTKIMKKLLQLTFILLLSLTVFSQNREAIPGSNTGNVKQSPIFQLLISEDNSHIHAQRDNDFLIDASYFYWWSDLHDIYECYYSYYYTYDENHNLYEKLEKWSDGSGDIEKRIYEYDVNNNLELESIYAHDNDGWMNSKYITYSYDAMNNLIYKESKVWSGSEFENDSRTTYVYDGNNRDYYIIERWDDDDQIWVNSQKWIYYYDESNIRDKILVKNWDEETYAWINGTQIFYTYDEETNNLIVSWGNNWDEENATWQERIQRNSYAYDAYNNRTIMEIDELYDPDSEWHNILLEAYLYVPIGSEHLLHRRNNLNKSIEDLQTTEDELVISGKQANDNRSLYGVEVLIDSVLHTSVGDLEFTLSHKGVTETIIYHVGSDGENFINTKLTDRAYDTISDGMAPFSGIYIAENPLSAFEGIDPEGTWTLSIYDGVEGNTGTLIAWGLNFIYAENSGVEDVFTEDITFKLFPNPAESSITFQLAESCHEAATLEIYNLNGKLLLVQEISSGTISIGLNLSHLPCGIYFCKLHIKNNTVTKKLIIK
jgi:subtilisin-like proprotein convertase family protein